MAKFNYKHGHSVGGMSPTYVSWRSMKTRCLNPDYPQYRDYGGRGITICERWMLFDNFLEDMGERPPGTSLDRIDNEKGYEPGNCRWATRRQQSNNARSCICLTAFGQKKNLSTWAREAGIPVTTLYKRVKGLGWPTEKALTTPVRKLTRRVA